MSLSLPASVGSAQAPKVGKPRPAPAGPSAVVPLPPAQIDNTLQIGGQDVKAKEIETRLSVEVQVNGRGPYRFLVDSGADTSAVGVRLARDLQLPIEAPVILNGMTSREIVDRVRVDQLTVGPTTIRNLNVPALREQDVGDDGLIGIDALVDQRLMMDFDKHVIKVEDARIPEKFSRNDIVIIARRTRGQLILTSVKAAGLNIDAVVDTGSEITIGNLALRDALQRHLHDKFTTIPAIGVTGTTINLQVARISELQLGSITLYDVPMAFADVPPFQLFGLNDGPALLLGTDLLETFRRVSLDFHARKVRFQLRHCDSSAVISTEPSSFMRLTTLAGADVCGR